MPQVGAPTPHPASAPGGCARAGCEGGEGEALWRVAGAGGREQPRTLTSGALVAALLLLLLLLVPPCTCRRSGGVQAGRQAGRRMAAGPSPPWRAL